MELSPRQAAQAANSAYDVRLADNMLMAAAGATDVRGGFDIVGGTRLMGTSGMGVVSRETGFGYVAEGRGSRANEVLITLRGTEFSSGHDWLTNFQIAGARGPAGHTVHRGFWTLAAGILSQINDVIGDSNPSQIHIAGHSLGGAAATLLADAIRESSGRRNVKLYTFGAPRAGVESHARHLTHSLGMENIFRVYHHTDPVPMVPVFPYSHVPYEDNAYLMRRPGTLMSIDAHIKSLYADSMDTGGWGGLGVINDPMLESFEAAQEWLERSANIGGMMLSGTVLRMIMSALGWILREIGQMVGYTILAGASIIDYIARLLRTGVLMNVRIGIVVGQLMAALLRFTGRTIASGVSMTVAFFQYVLDLLFRTVSTLAARAIDAVS